MNCKILNFEKLYNLLEVSVNFKQFDLDIFVILRYPMFRDVKVGISARVLRFCRLAFRLDL